MGITIRHSILSGILVGLGVISQIQISNVYISSMLFSIALLVIIECDLNLYTGRIGFFKISETKNLTITLLCNIIGVMIPFIFLMYKNEIYEKMAVISNTKFSNGYFELFVCGLLCGVLMFIAVYCKKPIITIFCIMMFILSGYEHCIADFPYLFINFNIDNLLKYLLIIIGNSFGSIFTNKLIKNYKYNRMLK